MDTTTLVVFSVGMAICLAIVAVVLWFFVGREQQARPVTPPTFGQATPLSPSAALKLNPSAVKRTQSPTAPAGPNAPQAAEHFVRVSGRITGSSTNPLRVRELDLTSEGDELHLHVHQHGESHTKVFVSRAALQMALDNFARAGGHLERLEVPGRTARKELPVMLIFHDTGETEVQADWWIRVGTQELKMALQRLGYRVSL
jgi:hypothetical protein